DRRRPDSEPEDAADHVDASDEPPERAGSDDAVDRSERARSAAHRRAPKSDRSGVAAIKSVSRRETRNHEDGLATEDTETQRARRDDSAGRPAMRPTVVAGSERDVNGRLIAFPFTSRSESGCARRIAVPAESAARASAALSARAWLYNRNRSVSLCLC